MILKDDTKAIQNWQSFKTLLGDFFKWWEKYYLKHTKHNTYRMVIISIKTSSMVFLKYYFLDDSSNEVGVEANALKFRA